MLKGFQRFETVAEYCARTGADPTSFAAMRMAALERIKDEYVRVAIEHDHDRFFRVLNLQRTGDEVI